jgi:O-antigen biosynthesis protein
MWVPIPILELELTRPQPALAQALDPYRQAQVLLKWRGSPVAWHSISVVGSGLDTENIVETLLDEHLDILARSALSEALKRGLPPVAQVIDEPAPETGAPTAVPRISVLVCTRERPEDLKRCLRALSICQPQPFEIIVVDNAPVSGKTKQVAGEFPNVRYSCEPRPGLDWARNRGILDAQGDVVAFVDDDVVVDVRWAGALQQAFARQPSVGAVTGLIAPYELATASQAHFEQHGGFGRGFVPKWLHYPNDSGMPWSALGTGVLGTGANMAFRRAVFDRIGLFLPELDTGTRTEGGGDLEILYRTLKHGYPVAYEPRALAWHKHRSQPEQLVSQIASWGIATFAMLESVLLNYPDEAANVRRYGQFWKRRLLVRAVSQYLRPARLPSALRLKELQGCFIGKRRYYAALERARRIELDFGPQAGAPRQAGAQPVAARTRAWDRERVAVRSLDLARGAQSIDDVNDYWTTRVFLHVDGRAIGQLDIENKGLGISRERLVDQMLDNRDAIEWLRLAANTSRESMLANVRHRLKRVLLPGASEVARVTKPTKQRVSIVLATCDRPQELRRCLRSLTSLSTSHELELLVVDNRPSSPATAEVLREFPSALLVSEPRQGLSYARNAGFRRASGDVIVCTDDDVVFADDWLERLLEPFRRNDIDVVCGNVLPLTLDAPSQRHFERYPSLGKGFEAFEADQAWFFRDWLHAVHTWSLGATANTAFRASLLRDPDVGMFEEVLGAGMPAGVGEDTYFFYRALLSGYRIRYEPSAIVWHEHRRTAGELERQLSAYSRGHVAYHLHTLFSERDFRALPHLGRVVSWHLKRVVATLRGKGDGSPLPLILAELRGNLAGPLALWQSHRIVRERGRGPRLPPLGPIDEQSPEEPAAPARAAPGSAQGARRLLRRAATLRRLASK